MEVRTEEDLKNKWMAQLGATKGAYYHHFWHQLHQLHMVWGELSAMHRQKKEALEIVDATIPNFWMVVSNSMWKEVIVGLCGYADPVPNDRSKLPDSVSFPFWIEDHTVNLNAVQKHELERAIKHYKSRLAPFKNVRDRYLGHWNADAWFKMKAPVIQARYVDRTLKDIVDVLNLIEQHNGLNSSIFRGRAYLGGDTVCLVDCLRTTVRTWNEENRVWQEDRTGRQLMRAEHTQVPGSCSINEQV